jgi:hypothetical protein
MLNFISASDFHLGGMKKVLSNPLPYQMREITKVYDYALGNSIPNLIVPGDLCHTPNMDDDELLAVLTLLLSYDGHINTRYIIGNHDVESIKKSSVDVLAAIADAGFFKTFKIYKQPTVEKLDGVHVAFMPFPHTEVPKCPKPPLVIAHIEAAGAIGDNGRPLKTGHDEDFKRQPGDFIVTGHLHQHQFLKAKRILFVGSLYQTNFGEALPKGFLNIKAKYASDKLVVNYEQIDSKPNFILETRVISSNEEWKDLEDSNHVRYRILVEDGLVVPKKINEQLKNIISITGLSKKTKLSVEGLVDAHEGRMTSAQNLPQFKITTGLKAYVKQAGLSDKKLKRAQSLAKEAAQHLGLLR